MLYHTFLVFKAITIMKLLLISYKAMFNVGSIADTTYNFNLYYILIVVKEKTN